MGSKFAPPSTRPPAGPARHPRPGPRAANIPPPRLRCPRSVAREVGPLRNRDPPRSWSRRSDGASQVKAPLTKVVSGAPKLRVAEVQARVPAASGMCSSSGTPGGSAERRLNLEESDLTSNPAARARMASLLQEVCPSQDAGFAGRCSLRCGGAGGSPRQEGEHGPTGGREQPAAGAAHMHQPPASHPNPVAHAGCSSKRSPNRPAAGAAGHGQDARSAAATAVTGRAGAAPASGPAGVPAC